MVREPVFFARNYGCTLDDAFIGVFVRVDRDDPRNDGIFCHEPYEKTAAHDLDDGDQYSNADIVTGISLMLLFIALRYRMGFGSVLIAHITFNLPYVVLSVLPKLKQMNKSVFEAALDLGASRRYAFVKVVFPDILPGILTGFLLSFTMSLDDFIITHFTKGVGMDTLSTKIYAEVRKGIKPEIYALSTILFAAIFIVLIVVNRRQKAEENR